MIEEIDFKPVILLKLIFKSNEMSTFVLFFFEILFVTRELKFGGFGLIITSFLTLVVNLQLFFEFDRFFSYIKIKLRGFNSRLTYDPKIFDITLPFLLFSFRFKLI